MRFLDGGFERNKEGFAQLALGNIRRACVAPALHLAMDEVLGRCEHVVVIDLEAAALEALDYGHSHAGNKKRILAVGFFRATPARVTGQVDNGRKRLVRSGRTHLIPSCGENLPDKVRIPSARKAQALRKTGAPVEHVAV